MAQSAVSAIKTGCQMLSEGRAEIASFKKTIESGVSDARALYEDVLGLWGWVVRLFQPKQTKAVAVVASAPKKVAKQPTTYEELKIQATNNICESLKTFFEIKRKLKEMCLELEEQSKTTDRIEDTAIDRIAIEIQLEDMTVQIREAMVYAPSEMKDIYGRFLKMYDQILEEQAFAREVEKKRDRDEKWRRELLRDHRIDKAVALVTVLLAGLWLWAMMLSLGWLVRTPGGMSSLLLY